MHVQDESEEKASKQTKQMEMREQNAVHSNIYGIYPSILSDKNHHKNIFFLNI